MQKFPYWRLSVYYFFYFSYLGGFSPYFGLYLQSLSFSAWDIGLLMSQMQVMRVLGPYFWGALADRIGQRLKIIRATSLATLLIFSAFFFVTRFESIFIVLAVLSFFWVAALPLVEALAFDHLRSKPAGYGRIRIWGSLGFIVAVVLIGGLLDHFGLSSLLWAIMLLLAGTVTQAFLLPEAAQTKRQEETQRPITEIIRQPHVRALLAACFFMTAAHGALNIFYSIFLNDHGYSKSAVGGLWSVGVLAEILVFFYMTALLTRFSIRTILLTSFVAAVFRFALIGVGVNYLPLLLVTQVMHGLTFGAFHAAAIATINRFFPGNTRSRGQALYSSISFGAGGLVGGLLSGWVWETLGGEASFILSSLYAFIGLLLVARWVRGSALEPTT